MLPASYRQLLSTPHVGRALGTSLLARTGLPTGGLAVILLVVDRTGSYGAAGLVSAVWVAGAGAGGLVSSRLIDRGRAAGRVLLTTATLSAAGLVVLSLVPTSSTAALAGLTAAAAVTTPPVTPAVRTLWPALLAEPDTRATMYSLEATVQELTFIVGPSAAGAAAALLGPAHSVQLAAAVTLLGVLAFAGTPGLDRLAAAKRSAVRRADLLPLVPLYLAGGLLICGLSWVEVGVIGAAGAAGATAAAGLLLAVWSAGSLVGGLLGRAAAGPARPGPAAAVAADRGGRGPPAHRGLPRAADARRAAGAGRRAGGARARWGSTRWCQPRPGRCGGPDLRRADCLPARRGGARLGAGRRGGGRARSGRGVRARGGAAGMAALVVVVGLVRRPRPAETAGPTEAAGPGGGGGPRDRRGAGGVRAAGAAGAAPEVAASAAG